MSLVLDASVTVAWVLNESGGGDVQALFAEVKDRGATVPSLWRLEVGNALTMSVRRGKLSHEGRARELADLSILPIVTDPETDDHAWAATLALADLHRLTAYDAAYLELAQRRRLPLATLDRELAAAARASGVPVRP